MSASEFRHKLVSTREHLLYFALRLTQNKADAEDLLQDSLLKALKYESRFQDHLNFQSWMNTILHNTFANQYRRKKIEREYLKANGELASKIEITRVVNPMQSLETSEIDAAITSLPENLSKTLRLNIQGYRYHEIAEKLEIPIGTVKSRIYEARKKLGNTLIQNQR